MQFSFAPVVAAFLIGSAFPTVHAQTAAPDPLQQARVLLEQRNAPAAYDLLSPQESTRAGDPAFDYLLGISALDAGHVTRAIFALERVLAVQPANNLARAEIARAYVLAGETDTARGELAAARRGPMPAEAAAAIDRVLSALSATGSESGPRIRGYVEFGGGWDSNINSATSTTQFALPAFGGLVFTLAPGSRERESGFLTAGAGINARVPITSDTAFVGAFSGRFTRNLSTTDFDPAQLDASAGLSHSSGANTFTGALQAGRTWIGGNGYRNASGLSGQWQHNVNATLQLAGFGQWSRITYPNQGVRDVNRYVLGVGAVRALPERDTLVFGSAYAVTEDPTRTGFDHVGHNGFGLRVGTEMQAGGLTWFGQAQAEWRRYGGTEPFFNDSRKDDQLDIAAGVHWRPAPQWRVTPQLSYTRNHSNIVIFSYSRTALQLLARREF